PRQVEAARNQIAALDLDVLFFADIGMDALTSTLAHSRMAPRQCVTWGHPDTTGSQYMDAFLSSEHLEVSGAEQHYTEKLIKMPLLGTYYELPINPRPDRTRESFGLPSTGTLYVSPQTLFKFHPDLDDAIRGILDQDKTGHLAIITGRVPVWTSRLQQRFE